MRSEDDFVPLTVLAAALAFGTGAMDVASVTRLGGVFSSVMTGNLVLLGLAAARPSGELATHTALAFAGYVTGAALGTWSAEYLSSPPRPSSPRCHSPPSPSSSPRPPITTPSRRERHVRVPSLSGGLSVPNREDPLISEQGLVARLPISGDVITYFVEHGI